jgi:5-oxoprolinase (ATP-hydrolysing) subunit A
VRHRVVGQHRLRHARCRETGTSAGAHPSYPDPANFGRVRMAMPNERLLASIAIQIQWLAELARDEGVALRHVKPHGALYNDAATDKNIAHAVVEGMRSALMHPVRIVGLAGSGCIAAYRNAGCPPIEEAFADRRYQLTGSRTFPTLVSRSQPGATLTPTEIADQIPLLLTRGEVRCVDGTIARVAFDSLCMHSDTAERQQESILERAAMVRRTIESAGGLVRPPR